MVRRGMEKGMNQQKKSDGGGKKPEKDVTKR